MTNISKQFEKIFNKKENDMDFWINACATESSDKQIPYKVNLHRYFIYRNRKNNN